MKKTVVVLASILALLLGACLPIFNSTPGPDTVLDPAATSLFQTAVAQTLTAQPTLTAAPVTNTAVISAASPTLPATLPPTDTQTFTPVPNLTTTPATATGVAANGTPAGTATLVAGQVTAIWTLAVRTYGTLPPAVPFAQVTLVNRAKAEAYISLQVTMNDGRYSILEYPVEGTIKIQAPVGSYLYVAWVGGNKMVGNFRLHQDDDMSIILYKDKIVIK